MNEGQEGVGSRPRCPEHGPQEPAQVICPACLKPLETRDDAQRVSGASIGSVPLADIYRRLGDAVERDIDEFDVDRGAERLAAWMQAPADAEPVPDLSATALSSRAIGVKAVDSQDPLAVDNPIRAKAIIVHLLSANTPLPADSGPYPFSTAVRNQRLLEIEIWEQTGPVESSDVEHNIQIGRGVLRLPPGLPAHSSIEITFSLSEAGTLGVHAVEPNSGAQGRFELQIGETVAAVRADIVGVELK